MAAVTAVQVDLAAPNNPAASRRREAAEESLSETTKIGATGWQ